MTALSEILVGLDPLLYYPFLEKSGTVCRDASNNGHDGTYVGGVNLGVTGLPFFEPGRTAIELNGVNGYVDTGWSTRKVDLANPLGGAAAGTSGWTNISSGAAWPGSVLEAQDVWGVLPDGSIGLGGRGFRMVGTHVGGSAVALTMQTPTGKNGIPVKPGAQVTLSKYARTVEASAGTGATRGYRLQIYWYTAAGAEISVDTEEWADEGVNGTRFSMTKTAPAEAAFYAVAVAGGRSSTESDLVIFEVAGIMAEQSGTLNALVPTPRQIANGDAVKQTFGYETGPFVNGKRTFVVMGQRNTEGTASTVFGSSNATNAAWLVFGSSPADRLIYEADAAGANTNINGTGIAVNQKFLLGLVVDKPNNLVEVNINGLPFATATEEDPFNSPGNLLLGAIGSGSSPFPGILDEFAVYGDGLTPAEFRTIAKAALPGFS